MVFLSPEFAHSPGGHITDPLTIRRRAVPLVMIPCCSILVLSVAICTVKVRLKAGSHNRMIPATIKTMHYCKSVQTGVPTASTGFPRRFRWGEKSTNTGQMLDSRRRKENRKNVWLNFIGASLNI